MHDDAESSSRFLRQAVGDEVDRHVALGQDHERRAKEECGDRE